MTDDFHLFGDPDDGDRPIDPDLALVSAYLARELSPMQVLALEERLATDAQFRTRVQPLLDAWAAPVPALAGGAARLEFTLSDLEREASWRRFVREGPSEGSIRHVQPRRRSMKRAAAVIALVVVPMASFAQAVIYAASNPEARGHAFARRIVAPFVGDASSPKLGAPLTGAQGSPAVQRPREVDTGSLLPVPTAPVFPLESESLSTRVSAEAANAVARMAALTASGATRFPTVTSAVPPQAREPNRARIAELAREHQSAVISGDTAADYIVMVMDASERYVWSTFGSGNLSLEIGGDERTPAERARYQREHRAELVGSVAYGAGVGGAVATLDTTRGTLGYVRGSASAGGGVRVLLQDSASGATRATGMGVGAARGVRGAGAVSTRGDTATAVPGTIAGARILRLDTGRIVRIDSQATGTGIGFRGARGDGSGLRVMLPLDSTLRSTTYRTGWSSTANPRGLNRAEGLTRPGGGSSGIEGLPSESVASADTYMFGPRELAPLPLRIVVVHLTPGAGFIPR